MIARRTYTIPGVPAAFQPHLQYFRCTCSIPSALVAFPKKMFFPDCSIVTQDAPCLVAGSPWHVVGASSLGTRGPRLVTSTTRSTWSSLWHTEVFTNLSQSLPWYSWTSHQRCQLLRRTAGIPFNSLILSCNWRIYVYIPHPLWHFWRLLETKIHFAHTACIIPLHQCLASKQISNISKMYFVSGGLREYLGVVGRESQGGQFPELTGPMRRPLCAPGSSWEHRRPA
jgi:hypothetical protein